MNLERAGRAALRLRGACVAESGVISGEIARSLSARRLGRLDAGVLRRGSAKWGTKSPFLWGGWAAVRPAVGAPVLGVGRDLPHGTLICACI